MNKNILKRYNDYYVILPLKFYRSGKFYIDRYYVSQGTLMVPPSMTRGGCWFLCSHRYFFVKLFNIFSTFEEASNVLHSMYCIIDILE